MDELLLEKCRHNPEWAANQISDQNKILEAVKQSHFSRVAELKQNIEKLEATLERVRAVMLKFKAIHWQEFYRRLEEAIKGER